MPSASSSIISPSHTRAGSSCSTGEKKVIDFFGVATDHTWKRISKLIFLLVEKGVLQDFLSLGSTESINGDTSSAQFSLFVFMLSLQQIGAEGAAVAGGVAEHPRERGAARGAAGVADGGAGAALRQGEGPDTWGTDAAAETQGKFGQLFEQLSQTWDSGRKWKVKSQIIEMFLGMEVVNLRLVENTAETCSPSFRFLLEKTFHVDISVLLSNVFTFLWSSRLLLFVWLTRWSLVLLRISP